MKHVAMICIVLALLMMTQLTVVACPVCYGDKASPMTAGMNTAILVMLGIVGGVLSLIVTFFLVMWRRYKRYQNQLSQDASVNEHGVLETKKHKGVVEWNNI